MTAILLTLVYTVCQSNYWAVQFGGTDPLSVSIFSKPYKGGYTSYLSPQVCHTTPLHHVFNHYVCVHCRPMTNCDILCLRRMWGSKACRFNKIKKLFCQDVFEFFFHLRGLWLWTRFCSFTTLDEDPSRQSECGDKYPKSPFLHGKYAQQMTGVSQWRS